MSIIGLGVDLIKIERIRKIIFVYKNKFARRILSKREWIEYQNYKKDKAEFLAKRFSVKEAVSKALGTGMSSGIFFNQIEILHEKNTGRPILNPLGNLKLFFKKLGIHNTMISISDEKNYAFSIVTMEK
ncbi:holo-ACP synthase [Candidatus Riesia pediculicola]|uniref:holo-ACP synthase n=1 Tax=Candidatus Riesia pediculicola TaxID=401619 RepID=UPI0009C33D57|nr:holo-ACP synthase [Candidatus Riesia pediculicola]ARC54258.1 hypothetical protein AOE57_01450 [Candidatus Riesia pediculicola]